jgi:Ca2+-binding EF-hand superfamily protein
MIGDAYASLSKDYKPEEQDTTEYIHRHDVDGDGAFTLKDLEKICIQYLCGPSGIGISLLGVESEKEKLLRYLYRELGIEPVNRELENAEKVFNKFDSDKDGYLNKSDLKRMIMETYANLKSSYNPSDEEIMQYFGILHTKREDHVSKEEYEIYVLTSLKNRHINF